MKKIVVITLLSTLTFTPVWANNLGYGINFTQSNENILVKSVTPNSVAAKSGLKAGQKVLKFNGKKINKIKTSEIENIDTTYKSLKLLMADNKQYNLKPENIDVLTAYNEVQTTYNTDTAYTIGSYQTNKIILPQYINNKNVRHANAYFNYADIIAFENAQLYINLFKITEKNLNKAVLDTILTDTTEENEYIKLYRALYVGDKKEYDIHSSIFRYFLRLAIYNEQNQDLINRQISEFNNTQQKQYAQLAYNTRIIANLYSYADTELFMYTTRHTVDVNKTDQWHKQLKTQNQIYNLAYKELCNSLSKHKIKINKPGPMSNRQQITAGVPLKDKYVGEEQIIVLAQAKGYNPNNKEVTQKSSNFVANSQPISNVYKTQIPMQWNFYLLPEEYSIDFTFRDQRQREFENLYEQKKYKSALKKLPSVEPDYSNLAGLYMCISFVYNAAGDIENAIKYFNAAFAILEKDGYALSSGYKHPVMGKLYLYRAYLYLKTSKESNLELVLKNIDNAFLLSGYPLPKECLNKALLYELLDDKNISSYMKHKVYQQVINNVYKAGAMICDGNDRCYIDHTYRTIPYIASYIEYIYSLDDNDPLFSKFGTNKTQILTSYIQNLRGKYAPMAKGIFLVASGQFEQGIDVIYNSLLPLEKYHKWDCEGRPFSELLSKSLALRSFYPYLTNLPKARLLNDVKIKKIIEWLSN